LARMVGNEIYISSFSLANPRLVFNSTLMDLMNNSVVVNSSKGVTILGILELSYNWATLKLSRTG